MKIDRLPIALGRYCALPVDVSTSTEDVVGGDARKTLRFWALIDTGASATVIDSRLAEHLALKKIGEVPLKTASHEIDVSTFVVDIAFWQEGYVLRPFTDHPVVSCELLDFDMKDPALLSTDHKKHGMLIGTDMLSRWTMTWDGPTENVTISDD